MRCFQSWVRVFLAGGLMVVGMVSACWTFGAETEAGATAQTAKPRALVGAYYFDGWAGRHRLADDPKEPWAKDAPTHLTRRMVEE
ncbi:MAG TPA: hypothetical protein PLQ00_11630, partial [Thermoguttaceae bacterium]|nr:hypothetical protein [Thermoguttaceae bacterium]